MDQGEQIIEEELLSFYEFCEKAGFTESEMRVICAPLISSLKQNYFKQALKFMIPIVLGLLFIYSVETIDTVNSHVSAVGRLGMIKFLPIWDWTSMFYEACLISNPFYAGHSIKKEDCLSCESLEGIDQISDVTYGKLLDGYLSRNAPVIITDAMSNWPIMNTDQFYFENITQAYVEDEKLIDSVPCVLISNIRTGSYDLVIFLETIMNSNVDKWFVHWQNCDINAVKALRKFYQRPYFLSTSVAPAHFNWVLMSSNYNANKYKTVELDSGLIMLAQLRGSTSFKLAAQGPCNTTCPELLGSLQEGEILVFTNHIWKFEYHPGAHTDNIAILTETIWDDKV